MFASSTRRLTLTWQPLALRRRELCAAAALLCEGVALALAFAWGLAVFFALHAVASALAAGTIRAMLPAPLANRERAAWLYFFSGCFFLPAIGLPLALGLAFIARHTARTGGRLRFELHATPTYDGGADEAGERRFRRALRAQPGNASLSAEARLQLLLAVQRMPARMANPLIRQMLADPSEDLRLIAYGILDQREKAINERIHAATHSLESAPGAQRALLHKHLAELYHELVYQRLAQGDLRAHAVERACWHVERAIALGEQAPALHALAGRIALSAGDHAGAERAFQRCLELGMLEARVLPYLAEVAFRGRRFEEVRSLARRLAALANTPRVERVLEYWSSA